MLILVAKVSSILLFDMDAPFTPARGVVTVFQSTLGLICVTALMLTFYPPAAYKRWIESRSPETFAES
jgi:predicted membrane chloride channel (bestrophin family)